MERIWRDKKNFVPGGRYQHMVATVVEKMEYQDQDYSREFNLSDTMENFINW